LVTGVGGTGVITIGALIAMAAHLEGRGVSVLDFTGFAQKFGPVVSYLRLASSPGSVFQPRIDAAAADALIGCDIVVSSSPKVAEAYRPGMRAVINTAAMPTGDIVLKRDADLAVPQRAELIKDFICADELAMIDANDLVERLFGNQVFANMAMLGFAWQRGLVPVSLAALERAIELNGVEVSQNLQALAAGRLAATGSSLVAAEPSPPAESLDEIVSRRAEFLEAYQDRSWSERYLTTVNKVRQTEAAYGTTALTEAVAHSLFKLMSYKDEYEVARLHVETDFLDKLGHVFEGNFSLRYHLAPPFLPSGRDYRGRPVKKSFGRWVQYPLRVLAKFKQLRGTTFDPFGYSAERRMERELIDWYGGVIDEIIQRIATAPAAHLVAIAKAPQQIRGYGPVKQQSVERAKAEVAALVSASRLAGTDDHLQDIDGKPFRLPA
jgi:indolepyruvate ferredoxin oxidoreductase